MTEKDTFQTFMKNIEYDPQPLPIQQPTHRKRVNSIEKTEDKENRKRGNSVLEENRKRGNSLLEEIEKAQQRNIDIESTVHTDNKLLDDRHNESSISMPGLLYRVHNRFKPLMSLASPIIFTAIIREISEVSTIIYVGRTGVINTCIYIATVM